jgi:hypothetical protein
MTDHPGTGPRPLAELHGSGLLWLINRAVLHPRGLALALHVNEHGPYGWSLLRSTEGEPWQFDPDTDTDGYRRAEATLAAALQPSPSAHCSVCGRQPVVYENHLGHTFCAHCANCDCGQRVCVRTPPDASGDDADTAVTSADTVRTPPEASGSGGVRVEYRARVPRHLGPAALAEGLQAVADARAAHDDRSGPARTPPDSPPDTGAEESGRSGPPAPDTLVTGADTVRTPHPDTTSGHPGAPVGIRGLLEHVELDTTGWCISVADRVVDHAPGCQGQCQERQEAGPPADDAPAITAWGRCWDRAEALRADLTKAAAAYEALRARVVTTGKYVRQQQEARFPLGPGDNRYRVLDTIGMWSEDPGPLHLDTLNEAP